MPNLLLFSSSPPHACPTFKSPIHHQHFYLIIRYVEAIVLVSDEEIKAAVTVLYGSGLVVEPSGSAAFAAIVNNKIPELEGKSVVCILSGGNVGKDELANYPEVTDVCSSTLSYLQLSDKNDAHWKVSKK
uniref:L-serine deaminase n=1 Tax=Scophthalmus maximus TaxID=52904 RepID=A0A8D3BBZ9_SCOMX